MYAQATLSDYWQALYSRKKVIFLVALSAMAFSIAISLYLPPVYEAKASFYVPSNVMPSSYTTGYAQQQLAQIPLKPLPDEKEAGIHIGILKSGDMAEKMHLLFPYRDISFFKKNVDFVTSPQLFIDIFVRDRNPDIAAAIANSYIGLYKGFHIESLKAAAGHSQRVLEDQLTGLDKQVATKTSEIRDFQQRNNLMSSSEAQALLVKQGQDLQQQLDQTIVEISTLREQVRSTGGRLTSEVPASSSSPIVANPQIGQLEMLGTRRAALTERIRNLNETTRTSIAKLTGLQTLEGEKKTLVDLRTNIQKNLAEARLQKLFPNVDVIQVQVARAPKSPTFPIVTLNAIVALVFGFAAGCYNALFLEYLRRLKLERIRRQLDDSPLRELAP